MIAKVKIGRTIFLIERWHRSNILGKLLDQADSHKVSLKPSPVMIGRFVARYRTGAIVFERSHSDMEDEFLKSTHYERKQLIPPW